MALSEEQKRVNKIIRQHKKMSDMELAESMHVWSISDKTVARVIGKVRYQIKENKEWYDIYRWSIEKGETEVKPWASICVQAYGYDYTTKYTLNTGYNTYETTLFDSEGWHTE